MDAAAAGSAPIDPREEARAGPRIVVLSPGRAGDSAWSSALRAVAPRTQLEWVHDLVAARAASVGAVDAIVVDADAGADALAWATALRAKGAPPVVVASGAREAAALVSEALAGGVAAVRAPALAPAVLDAPARALLERLAAAVLVVDARREIGFANRAAEALLAAEPGALLGASLARALPGLADDVARALGGGEELREEERMLEREGGRRVPVSLSVARLSREEGLEGGALVTLRELTELKQLQRRLLQHEKLASIGQLAAGIAHEINNPMGYVHANLSQLGEYLADLERVWQRVAELREAARRSEPDPDELSRASAALDALAAEVDADFLLRDLAKAIRESLEGSERIRHIVKDLRTFSAQDTAERIAFDVNVALDSTANMVGTLLEHAVAFRKQYAELPLVRGYPMALKQVFMNLLVNAGQAIAERRRAEPALRGEIRLRTALAEGGVRIDVADNGVGIEAEALPRIFDPFFTTKEVGVGTGLGLSTSQAIVRGHGGRLEVESRRGAGTRFTLWLPLEAPPEGVA